MEAESVMSSAMETAEETVQRSTKMNDEFKVANEVSVWLK